MPLLRLRAHDVEPDPLTSRFQPCRGFVPLWNHRAMSIRAADHLLRYHLEIVVVDDVLIYAVNLDLCSGNEWRQQTRDQVGRMMSKKV